MWSTRSDALPGAATPRRSGRAAPRAGAALLGLLLVLAGLSGCSPDPHAERAATGARDRSADPDVLRAVDRALDRRADAVRRHDPAAFTTGLAGGRPAFANQQRDYLAGLSQLPVGEFTLEAEPASLVRSGGGYWVTVDQTLELDGFDAVPVETRDRYRFVRDRGRLRLASVSDPAWEARQRIDPQPWDEGPVTVRAGTGVLVVTDAGSAGQVDALVADVERAVAAVDPLLPYAWDGRVVVYALSEPGFLSRLDDVPGGDPLSLDAVSYRVVADARGRVAGTRVVLNPAMVAAPGPARDRLLRHELTHVALGERADDVPTWLSEGLAEYVSVQPLAPEDRAVPAAALAAARAGRRSLPADEDFAGPAAEAGYGLAWWACEYVARTYGDAVLWALLDAMPGRDPGEVVTEVLGTDATTIARRSAALLVSTYRPR